MEMMKISKMSIITGLSVAALLSGSMALAASKAEIDASVGEALTQFGALDMSHAGLEKKSSGMLVFPRVTKAGAGVAGEYGEGVLQVNGKTVGYYNVKSASVGLTLGAAKRSEIIMFMTPESLQKFTSSKGWSIGADTGIALVSKGAGADYDTKTLQKPILGFVFAEKGLMADLSLEGSKIKKIVR
jgi:lipid-binding SYLF domain-containing protein